MWGICTKSSHAWRIGTSLWKIGNKLSHVKNWHQNLIAGKKSSYMRILVPNCHRCEELALNRHRYQWQNGEELESNAKFYQCEEYACMQYITFDFARIFHIVWDIGTKYVMYWYQVFTCYEIGTNSSQCEIYEVWNLPAWVIINLYCWARWLEYTRGKQVECLTTVKSGAGVCH